MGNRYASGRKAIAICDRCGLQFRLSKLKSLVIKTKNTNILVCHSCWDPDHPQLKLGMYPVDDPQALRNPRPDTSYWQGGNTGLQVSRSVPDSNVLAFGGPSGGSRDIQWGWNPVGFNNYFDLPGLNDALEATGAIGNVFISTGPVDSVEATGAVGDVEVEIRPPLSGVQGSGVVGLVDVSTMPFATGGLSGVAVVGTVTVTT